MSWLRSVAICPRISRTILSRGLAECRTSFRDRSYFRFAFPANCHLHPQVKCLWDTQRQLSCHSGWTLF